MDTETFTRATAAVEPTDRRERRAITRVALAVVLLAAIAATLWLTGVIRPRIVALGTSATAAAAGRATVHFDVVNQGAMTEHLVSASTDIGWATLERAWFTPDPLAPGAAGQLSMEFTVDCERVPPALGHEWGARLETQRPWGTAFVELPQLQHLFSGLDVYCDGD